jgi:hypothetical protein
LRESDNATDIATNKATNEAASSLERKLPSDIQSNRKIGVISWGKAMQQPRKRAHLFTGSDETADRVTDKAADKASSSLQKSDEETERATIKAGDKAELSLERKWQSSFFSLRKATKRPAEQPQQRRHLWRESDQAIDIETDPATDKAALSLERNRHNNRRNGFFSLGKVTK